ncbi:hypothetical protein LTR66_006383 [Elasticomyces elasticus]|nr:hypothetical protein LTR66_006383 [Elasticomyces elasticus]
MPAPLAKGIIISLSIIAALGLAVYENPQVQEWLEQQRRRIAEALRALGDDIAPETRREAEAFAFGPRGQNTAENQDASSTPAEPGSRRAGAVVATGRTGQDQHEAEARRRQGREYLAKRNVQMYELRQRKAQKEGEDASPGSAIVSANAGFGSFDSLVDERGTLRDKPLPSPPSNEPTAAQDEKVAVAEAMPSSSTSEMHELPRSFKVPGRGQTSALSGLQLGSRFANPFGDEFEMADGDEGAATPRPPPVPPKEAFENSRHSTAPLQSSSSTERNVQTTEETERREELSFEEQLARALSLSLAESEAADKAAKRAQAESQDSELAAAIAASLEEIQEQEAAREAPITAVAAAPGLPQALSSFEQAWQEPLRAGLSAAAFAINSSVRPLIDLSEMLQSPHEQSGTDSIYRYNNAFIAPAFPAQTRANAPLSTEEEEDLYGASPRLSTAALRTLADETSAMAATPHAPPTSSPPPEISAPLPPRTSTATKPSTEFPTTSCDDPRQDTPAADPVDTPTPTLSSHVSTAGAGEEEEAAGLATDSDDFVSMTASTISMTTNMSARGSGSGSAPASRASGGGAEEDDDASVVDVETDSDVDLLSEDGICTPGSWTDVGSEVGSADGE